MPIYEYMCRACNHNFEISQRISDDALVKCPNCGKPKLEKLISSTSFQLKGKGWYKTDYSPSSSDSNKASSTTENSDTGSKPKKEDSAHSDRTHSDRTSSDNTSKDKTGTEKTQTDKTKIDKTTAE